MFKKLNKLAHSFLFRSVVFIAIGAFFICSSHLVQEHHNSENSRNLSSFQEHGNGKPLECSDGYTYSYNNRNCGSENAFTNITPLLFHSFNVEIKYALFSYNQTNITASRSTAIYLTHSVLQV